MGKGKNTNEEEYRVVSSSGRKFLYNSKGLDVISLLVKYYGPMAHINKVIKLLKFKSAINLQCFLMGGAIERAQFYCDISHSVALSRLRLPLRNTADLLQI